MGPRVVQYLEDHGEKTIEEIAKGIKARPAEMRPLCVQLHLAGKVTRREREAGRSGGRPACTAIPPRSSPSHQKERPTS
jgi:hypothetical protein